MAFPTKEGIAEQRRERNLIRLGRMTEQARRVALDLSLREALSLGHNYIGPEHVLLAAARDVLSQGDAETVRQMVLRDLHPVGPAD